jgi:hypothetical protein
VSSFDDLEKLKKYSGEISFLVNSIQFLFDNALHNINEEGISKINKELKITLEQCNFWMHKNEPTRIVYDLKNFGLWLCDYIGDKEREFWNE